MNAAKHTILYIHGMGGGADSRIPSILAEYFSQSCSLEHPEYHGIHDVQDTMPVKRSDVQVICRTYSFDPEIAHTQIESWLDECKPDLIVGESLGSLHALRIYDCPVLLVSPALNTPFFFRLLSWLTWIPGVSQLFGRKYRPKEGDRQALFFTRPVLKKYRSHGRAALQFLQNSTHEVHAFFGTRDHYRRSGVVSVRRWKKLFGDTFSLYDGTHFMEEEYVFSLLIPKIKDVLGI